MEIAGVKKFLLLLFLSRIVCLSNNTKTRHLAEIYGDTPRTVRDRMIFSCNQRYGDSDVGRRQAIVHSLCSHALYRHSHPSSSSCSVNTRRQRDPGLGRLYRTLWSLIITRTYTLWMRHGFVNAHHLAVEF